MSHRFARRDPEEMRVEAVDLIEEAAAARRHLAGRIGVRIEILVDLPAVGRDFPDGVAPFPQESPEGIGAVRAGKAAANSNDRDWLASGGLGLIEAVLELGRPGAPAVWARRALIWSRKSVMQCSFVICLAPRRRSTSSSESSAMPASTADPVRGPPRLCARSLIVRIGAIKDLVPEIVGQRLHCRVVEQQRRGKVHA